MFAALVSTASNGRWFKDYGALILAGLAAAVSIYNAVASLRSKRKEWERDVRQAAYVELSSALAVHADHLTNVRMGTVEVSTAALARVTQATASVVLLGPREVGQLAEVIHRLIRETPSPDVNRWLDAAINEFLAAGAKALGVGPVYDDVDMDTWKARHPGK